MAAKYQLITELYGHTIGEITHSHNNWTGFLRSACYNYKCSFDDQVLIYAQRPDAIAVLELERWNKQFGRWVNKGATGIAVFDGEFNGKMRLKHYFDISDTHETRHSRPVPIWNMREHYGDEVIESLENTFGELENKATLTQAIISAAHNAVEDNMPDYLTDLLYCREDSFLEELDELNVEVIYRNALQSSVAYMLLTRCGLNADEYLDREDFQGVFNFNTRDTVNALGIAASDIAEMGLLEIAATVKNLQISDRKQNRIFAEPEKTLYNDDINNKSNPERSLDNGTDIQQRERLQHSRPDRAGGTGDSPWEIRIASKELSETAPQDTIHKPADIGQAEQPPDGDRADGDGQAGADDRADGGGARRDGGIESLGSDEMGSDAERHPSLGGGNDTERPYLQLALFPTVEEQIANIEKAEDERQTAVPRSSAFSISQQIIDEVLCSGSNEDNSRLRICALYKKDKPAADNISFLQKEYGVGGKGFRFGGEQVSVWFNGDGIRIAQGDTALNTDSATLVTWEQAAIRIKELLTLGRYMPQGEIDKVDDLEIKDLAAGLWYLHQDRDYERKDAFFMDEDLFKGGFPDSTAHIAELLAQPDEREKIIDGLQTFITAYEQDRSLLRFHFHRPEELLQRLYDLRLESLTFTADESFSNASVMFITQDEVDAVLTGGGSVQDGKFRIYSYFLQGYTAKEKANFLKNEYGWGGSSRTGFSEMHDGKGISFSRENNHMPYDKVVLPWSKAAGRIDELITDGRYMSQRELDYLPEYEKGVLSGEIYSFYHNQPQEVPRPYPSDSDYHDGTKIIREQLDNPEKVADILNIMAAVLENTADFDRNYERMNKAFDDLEAYQNGTFSLFTPAKKEQPNAPVIQKPPVATTPSPVATPPSNTTNESAQYEFHLGDTVYIGADEHEIYSLDDEQVVLRDMRYPLFTKELAREEFERRVRENPLNDHLKAPAAAAMPDMTAEEPIEAQIRDALEWRGYIVSDEVIADALDEYDGDGDYKEIADFIVEEYLSEVTEESPESLVGRTYEIDGRTFIIDSMNEEVDTVSLRDVTFQNGVGFPIFRNEHIDFIRGYKEKIEAETPLLDNQRLDAAPVEMPEPAKKEDEPLTPGFAKPKSRTQTFDPHPEIPMSERRNFVITDDHLGHGGAKAKFQNNIEAIRLLQQLDSDHCFATPEEQEILSRYVGWGGLPQAFDKENAGWTNEYVQLKNLLTDEEYASARSTTLNAHYTSPTVINAIYKAIDNMGFTTGNILDPGCGIGNFQGLLPDSMKDSKVFGIEIDPITGRIARQLYQKNSIAIQGYEDTLLPDSFFDLAIGNIPFGSYGISDKKYDKHKFFVHDYFFAKTLDKVRPGGIVAFITSKGTLDKQNPSVRKYIAQRADLLGAIRLPNTAFKANAGTEVTSDIIFLQKRDRIIDIEPDWVHLGQTEDGIPVNSYFVEHPDMMLGTMSNDNGVRMYGNANSTSCIPYPDTDLAELLNDAIQNIHAEITDYELDELSEDGEDKSIPADPNVRNFSYTVVDGQIYFRENSRMAPVEVSVTGTSRIKGMIQIRDCARTLIEYQSENYPDTDIQAEQAKLNRLYDSFSRKYGLTSSRANSMVFSGDSAYPLLCSLEVLDENGNLARKADMFTKRTIKPHITVTSVDTASEALAVSISEKAFVDLPFMAQLTGRDEETLKSELQGVIFLNIGGGGDQSQTYVTADEYLSGNVREKLASARAANAALGDDSLAVNVEALEKVQPKDLSAAEISVRLGATWLPPEIVQQFMYELLSTPKYNQYNIKIHYSNLTAQWNVEGKSYDRGNIKANSTYGTNRINAYKIIEETLNLRDVRIFDKIEDAEGNEKRVLNKKETAIAQSKQEAIKAQFAEWIWKDPGRRERLVRMYNDKFNCIRAREYDGSHIKFVGINPEIELRPHQINAIAHVLYGGNTLLAHVVGAGKTFEMVAAAQECKRLGLCNKSLFVVPNHLTEQWAAEYLQLYPSANILVATKKDFETKNRKKFCARIATGDYDAVIIGHSQFEKIPMSIERQRGILEQQMNEIVDGIAELKENRGEKFTIKQLERTKKSLQVKLDKLNDQSRKDDVVTFEELGVDRLFIDESHYYKNLFLFTKMRNVGGIAQTEAQKSSDLFMKCRYLDELTGGKGVVFATGTPISNSMVELYTIQRYLQYGTLVKNGLQHFDAWASTFGETVTAIELAPEGTGYRAKTRFAKFYNLPELMSMFREVADIQTADMLSLPVPKVNYHNVALKPSEFQMDMVAELSERAEAIRNGNVDPHLDNMLKVTNDGRKLALDQRLINEMLPDDPEGKVAVCAENVFGLWEQHRDKRLTQLIFCDLSTPHYDDTFNVYDDMKKKLIARGIPENEVVFIHDAKTEIQKKEIFAKVRSGQISSLLGSTQKMGAGTNVQDKLIALHDLDCPWRPSDLEQRKGRIERQGNKNEEVEVFRYVTENTFDAYLYQLVENKQRFISQIMTSKSPVRSAEDIDETALSYAEIKALATGNPHIKEKMDLDVEVARLKMLKANHLSQKYSLEDQVIKHFPRQIKQAEERIAGYRADIEVVSANTPADKENFPAMTIHGVIHAEKAEAGKAIIEACKKMTSPDPVPLGKYRGFQMELSFDTFAKEYRITLKNELSHMVSLGSDIHGNITRLDNALEGCAAKLITCEEQLENTKTQFENAKIEAQQPFLQEKALREKSKRLDELNILLNMDEKDHELIDGEPDIGDDEPKRDKGMER